MSPPKTSSRRKDLEFTGNVVDLVDAVISTALTPELEWALEALKKALDKRLSKGSKAINAAG